VRVLFPEDLVAMQHNLLFFLTYSHGGVTTVLLLGYIAGSFPKIKLCTVSLLNTDTNSDSTNNNCFVCLLINNKSMVLTIKKVTEKIKMLQETSEKLEAPLKAGYILIMQIVLVTVNRTWGLAISTLYRVKFRK